MLPTNGHVFRDDLICDDRRLSFSEDACLWRSDARDIADCEDVRKRRLECVWVHGYPAVHRETGVDDH